MRILIGIIAFAIWTGICIQWYVCGIKELCGDKCEQLGAAVSGNLLFHPSGDIPLTNDTTYLLRDSLLSKLLSSPDLKLQITGQFYSEEDNNTGYFDLGLARAAKVSELLFKDVDSTSLSITSAIFKPDSLKNQKLFRAVEFELLKSIKTSELTIDKITVYFPYNESETSLEESKLDSLKMIATETKKGSYLIVVEGHTDSKGADSYNLELGQLRAEWIKRLLLSYGADSELIKLKSYGETKPAESNNSEYGRKMNRRVIVTPGKKHEGH